MKRALILDLDNTIYPVKSISDNLFTILFEIIDQEFISSNEKDLLNIKEEMTKRPFQQIADKYQFSDELRYKVTDALKNIVYDKPMQPYEDYRHVRSILLDKFLVTTGFKKLQLSKVKCLGIEEDFKEIYVVDPETGKQTKKDIFVEIMQKYSYQAEELLVIGDDPESEIKAATLLGIDSFLFDPEDIHRGVQVTHRSVYLRDVLNAL